MSNTIPQPVIWVVQHEDGTQVREFDENGKETIMNSDYINENKNKFQYIGLIDCANNITYSINLTNGKFILGGPEIGIAKEHKGRTYEISGKGFDYRDGVIQYKCSKPILFKRKDLLGQAIKSECRTYNIGYKVSMPDDFLCFPHMKRSIRVVHCQAMLSIDADSLTPSIGVSFLAEVIRKDGKKEKIRI